MNYCPERKHRVNEDEMTFLIVPQPKGRPTIKRLMCVHCKEMILEKRRKIKRKKLLDN